MIYLNQIALTGGIPFAVTLPKAPESVNADIVTNDELKAKLLKGYVDIDARNVNNAEDAFKKFRETHAVLMENVPRGILSSASYRSGIHLTRGQEKNPGEFRHSQNWIGAAGSTIRTAGYIPPCPEDMETAMSDLEKYINDDAVDTVEKLDALHKNNEEKIQSLGRAAKNSMKLFQYIEANPIIDIQKTAAALGVTYNTASSAVQRLAGLGILVQTTDKNRNRIFSYEAYLNILRDGTCQKVCNTK